MKMKTKYLLLILLVSFFSLHAQNKADDITGLWLTSGQENPAKIQIYRQGDKYFGKIIWLKIPELNGKPRLDINNPEKSRRHHPVIGLVNLNDFKFNGDDEWKGGNIYDPVSGNTYKAYMYLKDRNTLKIRGYVGVSIIGRTESWIRVQ